MIAAETSMTPATIPLPYRVTFGTWLVISRPAIMAMAKKDSILWAVASTAAFVTVGAVPAEQLLGVGRQPIAEGRLEAAVEEKHDRPDEHDRLGQEGRGFAQAEAGRGFRVGRYDRRHGGDEDENTERRNGPGIRRLTEKIADDEGRQKEA